MRQAGEIRAVIFDMDGVLTDSEPLICAAAVAMFQERGLAVQPDDFRPFVGTGENRYISGVAEKYNFPIDIPSAKKRTYEFYLELVPLRLEAFPGAQSLVRACQQSGLKIAVASSADLIKIDANLRKIDLPPEMWDAIVTGDDVEHKKPAPDIFLAAAAKLGMTPAQCVVIEDAVNGAQAAKAAGMRCVAVAQTFPSEQLRLADLVKEKIADIAFTDLYGHTDMVATITAPPVLPDKTAERLGRSDLRYWGFWPTLGFALVIAAAFTAAQSIVVAGFMLSATLSQGPRAADTWTMSGLCLAVATCVAAPVGIGLTGLFAWLCKGAIVKEYLGLTRVSANEVVRWCIWLLLFVTASDALTSLLGQPIVPEFMVGVYQTATFLPLLWLALFVAAPLVEEIFFRGFLFQGILQSRLGGIGAVVLSALAWASIHLQYDAYGMASIFAAGLLLGYVRLATGSIYPTIIMHALMNLIATIQVMFFVRFLGSGN